MHKDYGATSHVKEPVMDDVERTEYDLSHWSMKCGAIGSLQTLSVLPVVAGDSISLDANCVFRLSPLRRNLYLDCVVDLFAFYVPHRHIYGSNWVDFIKAGQDEGVTLGTDTGIADDFMQCVGYPIQNNAPMPRWLSRGYIQIWNRYFRDPGDVAGILAENYFTTLATDSLILEYGLSACHLKRLWNCGILSTLAAGDYSLPLSGGEVNLYELAALKGRLRTESARDWFATRYQDLLKHTFDSTVNIDADQRPEIVMRSRQWLSGYDVDGTDDATLGTYAGKGQGMARLSFPHKFFPEHGTLWIMGLLRFPPIIYSEANYLASKPEPTYAQISGDPAIIRRSAPVDLIASDVFLGNNATALGKIPHSHWYREQPSLTHLRYLTSAGHPFINPGPLSSKNASTYISNTLYDGMFASTQLGHWNSQAFIDVSAKRFIPDPRQSIFAGTE